MLKITNDYVFKRVFAKKGNEDILMDLLIAILSLEKNAKEYQVD